MTSQVLGSGKLKFKNVKKTMNSVADTNKYTRLALPLMSRYKIPTNPHNYSVWYHYVAGTDDALTNKLDILVANGGPFCSQTHQRLYYDHCYNHENTNELQQLRQDLHQLLLSIINESDSFTGVTNDFNKSLSESISRLSEEMTVSQIRSVISDVIDETSAMNQAGRATTRRMHVTTQELRVLENAFAEAKEESLTDFLTQIPNRKSFIEQLKSLIDNAQYPLCLLMIDIDHFKQFNDLHGHTIGDKVLRFVARQLSQQVRGCDFVARYGGEEFVVLLPETGLEGAYSIATKITEYFNQTILKSSRELGKITVSIGISLFRKNESYDRFIDRADQALYASKQQGRNRVTKETRLA